MMNTSLAYACNPTTQYVRTEGMRIQGQSGLHSETLSQTNNGASGMAQMVESLPSKYKALNSYSNTTLKKK
jgi:hypothetical protein